MKYTFLSAAVLAAFAFSAPAFADMHEGDHGDGYKAKKMQEIDVNGDGLISKDEFLANKAKKFEEMDTNNDGQLSPEEKKEAWSEGKKKMKKWKDKKSAE